MNRDKNCKFYELCNYLYGDKNDKYYITCPGIAKCQSIIIPDKYNQSLYEYLYNIDLETRDWI